MAQGKPLHVNHCNHPPEDFIESYAGSDIYIYESPFVGIYDSPFVGKRYCVRHSSGGHDYTSIICTLEEARKFAEARRQQDALHNIC